MADHTNKKSLFVMLRFQTLVYGYLGFLIYTEVVFGMRLSPLGADGLPAEAVADANPTRRIRVCDFFLF